MACGFACAQDAGKNAAKRPGIAAGADQTVKAGKHFGVIIKRRAVNREHAGGFADAGNFFPGQLPVDINGKRCQKMDIFNVGLFVQNRLIQMRYGPPLRDVEAEGIGQLFGSLCGDGIAPGTEFGKGISVFVKGQIAVHHA